MKDMKHTLEAVIFWTELDYMECALAVSYLITTETKILKRLRRNLKARRKTIALSIAHYIIEN